MRPLRRIADVIRNTHVKNQARAVHEGAAESYGYLATRYASTDVPAERARLLRAMAGQEATMSVTDEAPWGPYQMADGRTRADSSRLSSDLLYLLADVEDCAANVPGNRELRWHRSYAGLLDIDAWEIAQKMAGTPDQAERDALLGPLSYAVAPTVGSQAAETVWCLRNREISPPHALDRKQGA